MRNCIPIAADSPIPETQYNLKCRCLSAPTACELTIARTDRIERITNLASPAAAPYLLPHPTSSLLLLLCRTKTVRKVRLWLR